MKNRLLRQVLAGAVFFFLCSPVRGWAEEASVNSESSSMKAIEEWIQKNTKGGEDLSKKIKDLQGAAQSGNLKGLEQMQAAVQSGDIKGLEGVQAAVQSGDLKSLEELKGALASGNPETLGNIQKLIQAKPSGPEKNKRLPVESREGEVSPGDDYRIQAGDKLTIKIFPEDPYIKGGEVQVSPEGNVVLPLLGKIQMVGATLSEGQETLRQILDRDYLVEPEVTITMMETRERSFVVLGQVKKPGTYQFPAGVKNFSLLEAVSQAGGFSDIANIKKIKILRPKGDKTKQVIHANAEAIIAGNDPDVLLEQGDVINVAESLF